MQNPENNTEKLWGEEVEIDQNINSSVFSVVLGVRQRFFSFIEENWSTVNGTFLCCITYVWHGFQPRTHHHRQDCERVHHLQKGSLSLG